MNGRTMANAAKGKVRVQVSLRLRPSISALDESTSEAPAVEALDDGGCAFRSQRFRFAHIFGPEACSEQVFAAHRAAVLGVLRGFDCTLMAYGTTGSGKTHTMLGSDAAPGIVPLAAAALFEQIASAAAGVCYSLQLSALEILEEKCVDLLHERRNVLLRSSGPNELHFHGLGEVKIGATSRLVAARCVAAPPRAPPPHLKRTAARAPTRAP